jgi:hypothetical protein
MRRQLAQLRPSSTSAEVLFNPETNKPYTIDYINICNVSGAAVNVSICHDADGVVYTEDTALLWNYEMAETEVLHWEAKLSEYQSAGNIAVIVSVASAVTFSAYGEIQGEQL